jgi:hypothetical protein
MHFSHKFISNEVEHCVHQCTSKMYIIQTYWNPRYVKILRESGLPTTDLPTPDNDALSTAVISYLCVTSNRQNASSTAPLGAGQDYSQLHQYT